MKTAIFRDFWIRHQRVFSGVLSTWSSKYPYKGVCLILEYNHVYLLEYHSSIYLDTKDLEMLSACTGLIFSPITFIISEFQICLKRQARCWYHCWYVTRWVLAEIVPWPKFGMWRHNYNAIGRIYKFVQPVPGHPRSNNSRWYSTRDEKRAKAIAFSFAQLYLVLICLRVASIFLCPILTSNKLALCEWMIFSNASRLCANTDRVFGRWDWTDDCVFRIECPLGNGNGNTLLQKYFGVQSNPS